MSVIIIISEIIIGVWIVEILLCCYFISGLMFKIKVNGVIKIRNIWLKNGVLIEIEFKLICLWISGKIVFKKIIDKNVINIILFNNNKFLCE